MSKMLRSLLVTLFLFSLSTNGFAEPTHAPATRERETVTDDGLKNTKGSLSFETILLDPLTKNVTVYFSSNLSQITKKDIEIEKTLPGFSPGGTGPKPPRPNMNIHFVLKESTSPLGRSIESQAKNFTFTWKYKEIIGDGTKRFAIDNDVKEFIVQIEE